MPNLFAQDDLIRTIGMGTVYSISYNKDLTKFASGGGSGYVYITDIKTGKVTDTLKRKGTINSLSLNFDGSKIAIATQWSNKIEVWDIKTKSLIYTFDGHTDNVYIVKFSPDGLS